MDVQHTKKSENQPILQNDNTGTSGGLPIRYVITCMCFLANMLSYGIRVNLSIAVLPMSTVYNWNIETQQLILGAFYIGYAVTPIIGGWMVGKFGGFPVLMLSMLLSSLSMLSTPRAADVGVGLLMFTRIVDGIGQGFLFPGTCNIVGKWSKRNEGCTLLSISTSGINIGPIVSSYLTVWLCSLQFLGGWPATFYLYAVCGFIWCIGWCIVGLVANIRWTSTFKNDSQSKQQADQQHEYKIPWKSVVTSAPVLSLCAANFGYDYGYYLLLADIPTFFKTILGFEITTTGVMTILPHVAMFIIMIFGGFLGDFFISREILGKGVTRKLFTFFALGLSSAALVLLGYSNNLTLSVILMTIAFGLYGFSIAGMQANVFDIAPIHSGLIIGIMYSISSCTGFIAPAVLGALTHVHNTVYQWREVFWITAAFQIFGLLAFLMFGSGEVQEWAKQDTLDKPVPLVESDH